jgi:uncharacterized alpha/beta hydrolase family protein
MNKVINIDEEWGWFINIEEEVTKIDEKNDNYINDNYYNYINDSNNKYKNEYNLQKYYITKFVIYIMSIFI